MDGLAIELVAQFARNILGEGGESCSRLWITSASTGCPS